jgi:uncharacterized protein (TIGR02271 family)
MDRNNQSFDIREGMNIIASDGESLGNVDHFEGESMVTGGGLFASETTVPISAVSSADADNVYLNVTRDAARNGQWMTDTSTTLGTAGSTTYADTTTTGTTASLEHDQQPFDHEQTSQRTHLQSDDDLTVELAEEELTARKRAVERGEVTIEKNVVAEEQTIDVPVTEERVSVSRRAVDRDVAAGDNVFEGGTIDVPVRGEEVDVQKSARVREEIEISKDAVQETERVTDTVRREEVQIDDSNASTQRGGSSSSQNRRNNR